MEIALTQTKLTWAFARNLAFFIVAAFSSLTTVSGQQGRDKTSVILIPPFENQTNQHENIKYEEDSRYYDRGGKLKSQIEFRAWAWTSKRSTTNG